ncbi:MAG: hypothetical protein Q7R75_01575 [bacterium]|nr:hypothetical protein [bacterium]
MEHNDFKKRIMRRVYAVWFLRQIAPVLLLQMPLFVFIAIREAAREFFIAKIAENFFTSFGNAGVSGVIGFSFSAARNTPFVPVLVIFSSICFLGFLGHRLFKNTTGLFNRQYLSEQAS